jgi:hypothetical protein
MRSRQVGKPAAAALDQGYWSPTDLKVLEDRGIEAYIATGREPHQQSWQAYFAAQTEPPPDDATPRVKMAYKRQTEIGHAIYRLRKMTVQPAIGLIKEALGFRQFSLRGLGAAAGAWCIDCQQKLAILGRRERSTIPLRQAASPSGYAGSGSRARIVRRCVGSGNHKWQT